MRKRFFGHPLNVSVGDVFESRDALKRAGVHCQMQAGICGTAAVGCESVVLSGGFVDDDDRGTVVVYTGSGGRSNESKRQVENQPFHSPNRSFVTSRRLGLPVRVSRRVHAADGTPTSMYRYDGLYRVEEYWSQPGADHFLIWRFRLVAIPGESSVFYTADGTTQAALLGVAEPDSTAGGPAPRALVTTSRIVRDSAVTREVKRLHRFRCQACNTRLETPTGPYAEAAHIRPLGEPHDGPDTLGNVLCLCPNHHATFDLHAWAVGEMGELIGLDGMLRLADGHAPDPTHLRYHRAQFDAVRAG